MCERALLVGLDGIALTEHDVWWPSSEMDRLRKIFPELVLFQGIEFSCAMNHFLIFFDDPSVKPIPHINDPVELTQHVHLQNGIVIWAHPFRFERHWKPKWLDETPLDGIEIDSSNMSSRIQKLSRRTAESHNWKMLRNSDAHQVDWIGKYVNEIPIQLSSNADFVDFMRQNT